MVPVPGMLQSPRRTFKLMPSAARAQSWYQLTWTKTTEEKEQSCLGRFTFWFKKIFFFKIIKFWQIFKANVTCPSKLYGAGAKVREWSVREIRMGGGGGFSSFSGSAPSFLWALRVVINNFLSSTAAFSIRMEASYKDTAHLLNSYCTFLKLQCTKKFRLWKQKT